MLSAYIPIAIFVAVATGFALFTLVFSSLLHSEKYNKVKLEPYECGIEPVTDARDLRKRHRSLTPLPGRVARCATDPTTSPLAPPSPAPEAAVTRTTA